MGKKPRSRMPVEQRAKQFAPFKAVDGLYLALEKAEEEHRRMVESQGVINVPDETEQYHTENEETADYGE